MRWIFRGILVIIAVVVVGMTALFAIPTDAITDRVLAQLSSSMGRTVEIRGSVRPRLFPNLGIRAEDIEIGNPDWVEEGPMVVAHALDVGVAWAPLLRGQIQLQRAELAGPRLILVRRADGQGSWVMEADETAPAASTASPDNSEPADVDGGSRVVFDEIVISDAAILFVDQVAGRTLQYEPVSARLSAPSAGAAELMASIGQPAGTVELEAVIGQLSDLQTGGISDLDLQLSWPGGQAVFEGRGRTLPALDGVVTAEATDLQPLFALAGLGAPVLPNGLGSDLIGFDADVTLAETGSLHLRGAEVTLDGNGILADLDILPGADRPMVRGNLDLGAFILPATDAAEAEGASSGTGQTAANPAPPGWSDAPIDVSALFVLDAELAVSADRVAQGDVGIDALSARLSNTAGRLEIDLLEASVFDGAVTGLLVANARNIFSARAELDLTDIALNPAVTALTGYERLEGTGSGQISLVGQGVSMAELMRDLDGSGAISFGPGAIIGLDIGGMIRNFDAGFQGDDARTVYSGITASFTVEAGVLANGDLAMEAPWGAIRGVGEVDIGARRLDYLVTPGVSARDDGTARVNVPVRIEGPWHDLSYRPDLEALANSELSEQVDALEDAATEAARDLVRDQLGVNIEEGASREEAIDQLEQELGDRLEEGLNDALRSLFD